MSTSFTKYAQSFMSNMAPTNTNMNHQNINLFLNNNGIIVQQQDNYNINNNYLVINRFEGASKDLMNKEMIIIPAQSNIQEEAERQRRDSRGIPIVKGLKKHKVVFADRMQNKKSLIEKVEIESYKKYNMDNTFQDEPKTSTGCCRIF
jgi:hypothetical protein